MLEAEAEAAATGRTHETSVIYEAMMLGTYKRADKASK